MPSIPSSAPVGWSLLTSCKLSLPIVQYMYTLSSISGGNPTRGALYVRLYDEVYPVEEKLGAKI
tara:strand:+ start:1117 stop:1308 length:192 start_codon:yes stop_codon:yes gene_type:complete